MTAFEVLVAARELISDPEHWTQRVVARDQEGNPVLSCDQRAVCFCVAGAINRVCGTISVVKEAELFLDRAATELFGRYSITFATEVNDLMGHKRTLKMCDRAIELARVAA